MIGFNSTGFAGKTETEKQELAAGIDFCEKQNKFYCEIEDNLDSIFRKSDNVHAKFNRVENILDSFDDRISSWDLIMKKWFWFLFVFINILFFCLGWLGRIVYFSKFVGGF